MSEDGSALTLRIGGLQPLTTIELPGRLAAVVFVQGCNLRCAYCHNPELLADPESVGGLLEFAQVLRFLERRQGLLDAVVFSGGEPTFDRALPAAMREVRRLGYAIALHTNGTRPDVIATLLDERLLAEVAIDVKAPRDAYQPVSGADAGERVWQSLEMLRCAPVGVEVRTTFHPEVLSEVGLKRLADQLVGLGLERWTLQRFRPGKVLERKLADPGPDWILADTLAGFARQFPQFQLVGEPPRAMATRIRERETPVALVGSPNPVPSWAA